MTVTVANTLINNTWDFWRLRTNQMADILTRQAVTVGGNNAVGTAVIDGKIQVTNGHYITLSGGTIAAPADLQVLTTSRFAVDVIINRNLTVAGNTYLTNAYVSQSLYAGRIEVGNTIITTANCTSGKYYGTWDGATIAINKGGTGITLAPGNGQVLVGANGAYTLATIANNDGIGITNGSGAITISNNGVLRFRANTTSAWRSGNVTLDAGDIINALGYYPGASNTDTWIVGGADINYFTGNVAIGIADGGVRANAALTVRTATNVPTLGAIRAENGNASSANASALFVTSTANNSALQGIRFSKGANTAAGLDYDQVGGSLLVQTDAVYRFAFDKTGNLGVGITTPNPNKGGTGVHVAGTNAGVTLDDLAGRKWNIGLNPNMTAVGAGVRRPASFGIFSDEANTGLIFDGAGANTVINVVNNGATRLKVLGDGRVAIGAEAYDASTMLTVGGDINTSGAFTNFSDYRLKHDVKTLPDNAMDRILALNPVTFRWNKNDQLEEGFLAHELQSVVPTAVQGIKDGVVNQVVDKSQLHPVIVKALQELINTVKQQQQEIDSLKRA